MSTSSIDFLDEYGGAQYLGDVKYWTVADFMNVENFGAVAVTEYSLALAKYLMGYAPEPGFNIVNPESLAEARDGNWVVGSRSKVVRRHVPWTHQEYNARKVGILPDDDGE